MRYKYLTIALIFSTLFAQGKISLENVLDITEYDLRIRKYQELIPNDKEINNLKKISKEEIVNIIFRYKQRTSLIL